MSLFTSDRERRLWLWTLAVLAAIYATLGPARALTDILRERGLLEASFAIMLAFLVGAIVASWMKRRPGWREIGVALGVALAYATMFARMENPAERTHLIEYGIVAALIHQALLERSRNGGSVPMPAALAVLMTALLGALDECIQALLPNRVFDVRDIFFNAFAGFMVIAARLAIAPQRRPGWRVWFLWLLAAAYGWGTAVEVTRLGELSLRTGPSRVLAAYLGVAAAGLLVGVLQWLVLRKRVDRAGWWVLTSLGAAGVFGVLLFGPGSMGADMRWVVATGSFGPVAGALQWLVLRGQIPRAAWWIPASAAGWILGMPVGEMVGWNGIGAVYGAVTGAVLVWLLRRTIGSTRDRNELDPA